MRRLLVALVASSLVLLTPGLADASSTSTRDQRGDVDSRLDLKQVALTTKGANIVVTFRTWAPFSDDDLARPGGIGVDFKVSKKRMRSASITWRSSGAYGQICTYQAPRYTTASRCSRVQVARLSGTAYRVAIPLAVIDKGARTLYWRASSLAFIGVAGCTGGVCVDGVGNGAKFYRWRR